jgi:hypothetical protein
MPATHNGTEKPDLNRKENTQIRVVYRRLFRQRTKKEDDWFE